MDSISILQQIDPIQLSSGIAIATAIALVSIRYKALTVSGAVGMIIVGGIAFGLGGIVFAVPLIFFFVSSSLFSSVRSSSKQEAKLIFDKTGPRDIRQVLSNGGIASLAVALYFVTGNHIWYFVYLAAICEAAADTWATELGTLLKSNPISIVTLKKITVGQSGGISLLGTLASAVGSLAIMGSGLSAAYIFSDNISISSTGLFFAAANAGFAGALFDSVLGGSLQTQYQCVVCGKLVESNSHCGFPSGHISGLHFMNNDMVNFVGTLFAAVVVAILIFY